MPKINQKSHITYFQKEHKIYDHFFDFEELKQSWKFREPSISTELLRRIDECNRLLQLPLNTRNHNVLGNYKQLRNKLISDIKKKKLESLLKIYLLPI